MAADPQTTPGMISAASLMADAIRPLAAVVLDQDTPGRDFEEALRGIGDHITLSQWRKLCAALAVWEAVQ